MTRNIEKLAQCENKITEIRNIPSKLYYFFNGTKIKTQLEIVEINQTWQTKYLKTEIVCDVTLCTLAQ